MYRSHTRIAILKVSNIGISYIRVPTDRRTLGDWAEEFQPFWRGHWRYEESNPHVEDNEFRCYVARRGYWLCIAAPYSFICLVTALVPAARLTARFRFRKRPLPGLCLKCRYDLRATPDRCPECGMVVAGAGAHPHSGHLPAENRKS